MKELIEIWRKRQWHYEELAEKYKNLADEHNCKKYTYKAIATRDCLKELQDLLNDELREEF